MSARLHFVLTSRPASLLCVNNNSYTGCEESVSVSTEEDDEKVRKPFKCYFCRLTIFSRDMS